MKIFSCLFSSKSFYAHLSVLAFATGLATVALGADMMANPPPQTTDNAASAQGSLAISSEHDQMKIDHNQAVADHQQMLRDHKRMTKIGGKSSADTNQQMGMKMGMKKRMQMPMPMDSSKSDMPAGDSMDAKPAAGMSGDM
jgi:hypothetical protein